MVGIPVNVSYIIDNPASSLTMQSYLERLFEEVDIIRAPIYKYQKIEWDGGYYYLTSPSEMINARQLCLPHEHVSYLAVAQKAVCADAKYKAVKIFNEWPDKVALNKEIYIYLCEQINNYYPRYNGVYEKMTAVKTVSIFDNADIKSQVAMIFEILNMLHCDGRRGLSLLSLSPSSGRMNCLNLSSPDIRFINTSVTGMYES
jgi:CRISPR-associated endonuclease Csn1